jgi:hypothetical protein
MPSSGQSSSAVTRAFWGQFFCDADIVGDTGNRVRHNYPVFKGPATL